MLTIKNPVPFLLLAALALSACAPSGPSALLEGKRRLDDRKYEQAIPKLEFAAEALRTNAVAWNYLGLALHQAGRTEEARKAYLKALGLDRSLSEARYNLGCLHFEQNNFQEAKSAFTAYTIEQDKEVAGFLRLGAAASRLGDFAVAERALQNALRLSPENPDALTGLGVLRQKKGRSIEAAEFFARAIKSDPQFAPAIFNYAVVARQNLKDRPLALKLFQQYLAVKPAPPDTNAVIVEVSQLQRELAAPPPARLAATATTPASSPKAAVAPPAAVTNKPAAKTGSVAAKASPPQPASPAPASREKPLPESSGSAAPQPATVVKLQPDAEIKTGGDVKPAGASGMSSATPSYRTESKPPSRSLLSRIFGSRPSDPGVPSGTNSVIAAPSASASPSAPSKKYIYLNPPRPVAGNRQKAERVFADGVTARQQRRVSDAVRLYRQAAEMDPAFFNAHYNLALALTELGDTENAARSYEKAIAARPDSLDARFNFALLLKQMGCHADSVTELDKLVVISPTDARAHLMMGNIYSQQMRQNAKAREHYMKALESDPGNPQAAAIRQWLASPGN